jgi:carboxymethylenebutenolidase
MNDIQRYLATEIAENCEQGQITRTEALRRLRLMGLSAAVALSLLGACGSDDENVDAPSMSTNSVMPSTPSTPSMPSEPAPSAAPTPDSATPSAMEGNPVPSGAPGANADGANPPGMDQANGMPPQAAPAPADGAPDPATSGPGMGLPTEAITFMGPNGTLQGAFAAAANPRGAVLVIHENRGLNDHIRTVVGRFAAAGFTAIGLDLLSEEGGSATFTEAEVPGQLGMVSMNAPTRFVEDMRACLDELERRAPGAKLGAVGFCFGGGMMWQLIASGDPRLAAAAPFYGTPPANADFTGSSAAVLAFYGETDMRVNATREDATAALVAAGLTHEIVTEPGAGHAFFNDTGGNYNVAAATDAWARVLAWFDEHLSA